MTPIGAEPDSSNAKRGTTAPSRWVCRIFALVLLILGLALTAGGVVLVKDAGSAYYLITGLAFIISGVLLWRGDARGIWVYGAVLVWTTAWSLWEVGYNGWQLAPRLIGPFVLGGGPVATGFLPAETPFQRKKAATRLAFFYGWLGRCDRSGKCQSRCRSRRAGLAGNATRPAIAGAWQTAGAFGRQRTY
jgi:hypothetical protein